MWITKKLEKSYLVMESIDKKKALNLLGMATRARKLISGEEQVLQSIQKEKVNLVICTTNSSENTVKKIKNKCEYYEIPFIQQFTTEEVSQAIGKRRSIIAIADQGFTKSLMKMKGFNDMNE